MSRIRHIEDRRRLGATGPMRAEYDADAGGAVRRWVAQRLEYHRRVAEYFASRPGMLLVVDICGAQDPAATRAVIARFVGRPDEPGRGLPHENARDAEPGVPLAGRVRTRAEVLPEVEAALAAVGVERDRWGSVFP